ARQSPGNPNQNITRHDPRRTAPDDPRRPAHLRAGAPRPQRRALGPRAPLSERRAARAGPAGRLRRCRARGIRRRRPRLRFDGAALRTTATRDGDHYVLNGTKQFITSGKNGDVAIVMAVTDKAAGKKGISAFWVPTDTPGYIVAGIEHKMGQHSSDTAQIVFDNCRVPAENLIGEEGQGYKIALSGLEGGRIGIASQSVGM